MVEPVKPDLGIAIPTLNSARYVEESLLSLRRQEGVTVRVVVADSGSTDGTLDICERLSVPVIYVPKGNMYRAINAALQSIGSTWLSYLNSDDFLYADGYRRLIAAAVERDAAVAYGAADFIDAYGRYRFSLRPPVEADLGPLFDRGTFGFLPHCAIFRRDVFTALGGFSEQYRIMADLDFFARAARRAYQFAAVREPPVGSFRMSSTQLSRREAGTTADELRHFLATGPKAGLPAALALWRWRLRNSPNYLVRRLHTGEWRGPWP